MADGADDLRQFRIPEGASVWRTEENRPPVRPYWGHLTPSIVNVSLFQQEPPPSVKSAEFKEAMHEVSTRAKNVTAEEWRIVNAWADAAGTSTPAGHWNRIACGLGRKYHREETHALEATTLMNLSLFDAGILCWREKYTYWLARPNQVDRELRPLLKVPNFPAYPSGHSAFSGAAARVLAYFYPEALSELEAMARQASESRIIAGIHYRFDCEEGLRIGRWAAKSAISAWQTRKRFIDSQWWQLHEHGRPA
jgi:hypothetical protein